MPSNNSPETAIPPLSPDALLVVLAKLDEKSFEALSVAIQSPDAFSTSKRRCDELGKALGLESRQIRYLLLILEQFYNNANPQKRPRDGLQDPILELLGSLDYLRSHEDAAQLLPIIADRIEKLIVPHPNIEGHRKVRRLRQGFLPNVQAIASHVDLRPDYDRDRSAIQRLVPMIQVRISTDAKPRPERNFVFQISIDKLAEFDAELRDIRKKLDQLRRVPGIASLLIAEDEKVEGDEK